MHVEKFAPEISDPVEMQVFEAFRWFTLQELKNPPDRITPLSLAKIVEDYMREGAPKGELALEVLVD